MVGGGGCADGEGDEVVAGGVDRVIGGGEVGGVVVGEGLVVFGEGDGVVVELGGAVGDGVGVGGEQDAENGR